MARGEQQNLKASFGKDIKLCIRACKRLNGGECHRMFVCVHDRHEGADQDKYVD